MMSSPAHGGSGSAGGSMSVKQPTRPTAPPSKSTSTMAAVTRTMEQERLHVSFQDDRRYLEQMVGREQSTRNDRIETILELKQSIERSSAAIQSQNAQVARRAREVAAADAAAFQELLNQGKNPYEVARQREVREAAEKERRKIEQRIQDKQTRILQHLEVEKVWLERRERIAEEHRAYEQKYQKEMGRSALEERTKQYLISRTGQETIDPTGKVFRIYPSQETTIKDRSFGVGKNLVHDATQRHAIVDKVHKKPAHRDASANPMLLPRAGAAQSNQERAHSPATDAVVMETPAGSVPGHELREVHHAEMGGKPSSTSALPPLKNTTSTKRETGKKGFGPPKRSVLEQRLLDQALERQKTNVFQKQIVWGKEFTGRAFLSDPDVLWFRDFDVGVPMTLSFTLTNVSNTFNQFKLLDLDETIKEFFTITYTKPGRMSAGMSVTIQIEFVATHARDIESVVPALAQTGPFAIPLKCTCKKAVPVLVERRVVFQDVVAGEKAVISVVLANEGALPLEFCVRAKKKSRPSLTNDAAVDGTDQQPEDNIVEEDMGEGQAGMTAERGGDERGDGGEPSGGEQVGGRDAKEDAEIDQRQEELLLVDGASTSTTEEPDESPAPMATTESNTTIGSIVDPSVLGDRVPLSLDEQRILEYATSLTLYRPEGADRPLRHTQRGTVAPYSTTQITFTFSPAAPMVLDEETFIVSFPGLLDAHRQATWASLLAPLPITIQAHATQVPIFIPDEILDFRCCLYDRLYRHQLRVCNRGKVALKMQIRVPKALEGCLEFHPNMGYVQGTLDVTQPGEFPVQVKFRPTREVWERIERKKLGHEALGYLAVPIQVVVPDQVIPVYFLLTARLSPADVTFSSPTLDFGPCALGHSAVHALTITNTSRLPQRLAFVKLPSEIRLENGATSTSSASANPSDDGLVILLPLEQKTLRVIYQPGAATTLRAKLTCRTTTNREYTVTVTGEGIAMPLTFSHSVVQLAATQLGQRQVYSITCTSSSDKPQTLELVVPKEAEPLLRVTPTVATIAPRCSLRVELEFTASAEIFALDASVFATKANSERQTAPTQAVVVNASHQDVTGVPQVEALGIAPPWLAFGSGGIPGEPRSVHHTWTVLCFRQVGETAAVSRPPLSLMAIQVMTTVIEPALYATPPSLNFGQVAIGQTLVKELSLTNESTHDVVLRARALHVLGGFRMVNSVQRRIRAEGGVHVVKVEFRPQAPLLYDDELELECAELGVIRVAMRGEGINPSLSVTPSDGVIDFKDVLARNRAIGEYVLTNSSAFPLTFELIPLDDHGVVSPHRVSLTTTGLPVFTCSPSEATIPAQGSLTVKVVFAPDHQRPQHYRQQYLVQVPNESERHILTVSGRAWENQIYVYNPTEPPKLFAAPPVEDFMDLPPTVSLASLVGSGSAAGSSLSLLSALAGPGVKKPASLLTVVFDGSDGPGPESKTMLVGGTLAPQTADEDGSVVKPPVTIGSFEFAIEENPDKPQYAKMFSLEPMKGTVVSGQHVPIQVTYVQPTEPSESDKDHPELVVSQWIQVNVTCTLKGGFLWRTIPTATPGGAAVVPAKAGGAVVPASEDSRTVQIILRAKMQT